MTFEPPRTAPHAVASHALAGIRVVDFSWVMAGPLATKMLAAMGAEVIKIESATRPEHVKRYGWSSILNAGKLSCTINLAMPEGQALLRRLLGMSDILVENFSAGVLTKYGLGYEALRSVQPDLIYVSASGVGREGPQRDALAYGTLLQAYSGRAGMIAEPNPQLEAMGILPAWTDPVTAMWECCAILAAIRHRRHTGEGAFIDLSMLESTVALLPESLLREALGSGGHAPGGNLDPDAAPGGCFRCAGDDAWLVLSVREDAEWAALCVAMQRADLAGDPRFHDQPARQANRAAAEDIVATWLRTQPAAETEQRLQGLGVPAARSRHVAEIVADPQFDGLFPVLEDGARTIALPWADGAGWRGTLRPAPELGTDNDYVFRTLLGLDPGEIERLTGAGVLR
jgi:benzylsuccinate CoA-transferase BbsF subunit